jgi:hypothetical protein
MSHLGCEWRLGRRLAQGAGKLSEVSIAGNSGQFFCDLAALDTMPRSSGSTCSGQRRVRCASARWYRRQPSTRYWQNYGRRLEDCQFVPSPRSCSRSR